MAASPNKQTGFISAKEPPPTVMNDTTDGSTKVTNEKVIAKKTCRHFTNHGRTKTVSDYLKIFVAEKDEKKRPRSHDDCAAAVFGRCLGLFGDGEGQNHSWGRYESYLGYTN